MYLSAAIKLAIESHNVKNIHYVFGMGAISDEFSCVKPFRMNIHGFTHDEIKELVKEYPCLIGYYGENVSHFRHNQELFSIFFEEYVRLIKEDIRGIVTNRHFEVFISNWFSSGTISRHEYSVSTRMVFELLEYYLFDKANPISEEFFDTITFCIQEYKSFSFFKRYVENYRQKICDEIGRHVRISEDVLTYCIGPYLECGILKDKH